MLHRKEHTEKNIPADILVPDINLEFFSSKILGESVLGVCLDWQVISVRYKTTTATAPTKKTLFLAQFWALVSEYASKLVHL